MSVLGVTDENSGIYMSSHLRLQGTALSAGAQARSRIMMAMIVVAGVYMLILGGWPISASWSPAPQPRRSRPTLPSPRAVQTLPTATA
jgi:hypothetical protein